MQSVSKLLKGWSVTLLIIGCFLSFGLGINFLIELFDKSVEESSRVADGFTIENYDVVLDINENNSIDVKESITVNFYKRGYHGIYRFIPEWLEYTNKDNYTLSRKAQITNLVSYSDDYSVSAMQGKKQIKMGNADSVLSTGEHTYVIGYTYDMGSDAYDNFDEFIFHAFGDFWGTRINNATIEIHLPKDVDINNNIHFFADKYRRSDITSYVDYTVYGNTIYANLSPDYSLNKALTIDIELPDGYFLTGTNNYGILSLLLCIICIVFAIISFLLWNKNGRDLDKVPETVEFYPPEQMDAAQVGYLYKGDTGRKLAIALIVELASKGFIKINESEGKKKRTIVKVDYADDNKSNMTKNEKIVYDQLFKDGDATVLSENHNFYNVFSEISENLSDEFDDKINDLDACESMLLTSFGFLTCSLLWGLAYFIIEDLDTKLRSIYLLAAISNIITFIFSILMERKTSYGEQIKAKIISFRKYIETAKKKEIESFAEDNPNYFYDILPYAYALDVSKKWVEKFENIPVPTNDMGNFAYYNIYYLDDLSSSMYYPSSSSSGCSSCGGGGGGCSSCGGGGSW